MAGLSKRRGAISVFLLIIFMVTYVFMGLLVDAGRYRMAKVYAESALDSATNSLLSSYDRLVFDLYGLFAYDTDAKTEEELVAEIEARYALYLDEALGIAKVDSSKYTTQLANTIKEENGKFVLDVSSLYDFSKTDLEAGWTITLADTKNAESQIIEYMKFRAPIQLLDDMNGFLGKVEAILSVKDSIKIASEKNVIVDKYENPSEGDPLSQKANVFIKDMNRFSIRFYNFTIDPTAKLPEVGTEVTKSSSNEPYRLMNLAEEFDTAVQEAITQYESERSKKFDKSLNSALTDLQKAMKKDDSAEITVSQTYAGEDGRTKNFTEMDLFAIKENSAELQKLAEEVKNSIGGGESYYSTYLEKYDAADAAYAATDPELESMYKERIQQARTDLETSIANIETNSDTIYAETQAMFTRMQTLAQEYDNYVTEMEAFLEKYKNAYETAAEGNAKTEAYRKYQDALTQSGPTVELAKANGGEITRNLELLGNSRGYLNQMANGYGDTKDLLSTWIGPYVDSVMDKIENPVAAQSVTLLASDLRSAIDAVENYTNGKQSEDLYLNVYKEAVGTLFPSLQGDICTLYSKASYFQKAYYRSDVDVEVGEEVTENDISKSGKETLAGKEDAKKKEELKAIDKEAVRKNPTWIDVNYSEVVTEKLGAELENTEGDASVNVELETGKVGLDFLSKTSNAGNLLMNSLADLMEGARDNLYVDAYVMSMFPNYKEWKDWKDTGKSDLKALNAPYENGEGKTSYNASYGAVEYVITGAKGTTEEGFGENSVEAMRVKLFGTRMLFNALSIMLDSGKITQAQSLSAWAGVLAPLVTVVLLAAWAAMESVIDVMVLMGDISVDSLEKAGFSGEGVLVFKKGRDWYFSANGLMTLLGEMAIDTVVDKAIENADELADAFEQKANAMIFDAYTNAQESVDAIYEDIDLSGAQQVNEWVDELNNNLKEVSGATGTGQFSGLTSKLDEATEVINPDRIKQEADDVLLKAKEEATLGVSRLTKEAKDMVDEGVKALGNDAKKVVKDNMHKVIPVGKVVNTGTADDDIAEGVRMTYEDYLYFYLFTMDQETKVQRIQSLVQVNMRVGGDESFSMSNAVVSAWADLECTIKYLFMSNPIVPESMKKDGRLRFKVISAQSY